MITNGLKKVGTMKILFHRLQFYPGSPTEYLGDSVLYGLKKNQDIELVDTPRIDIMYNDAETLAYIDKRKLFSLYGKLPDTIDRQTAQFFEPQKIICTLHHSTDNMQGEIMKSLALLKKKYNLSSKDICVLDGQDSPQIYQDIANEYKYFKRECQVLSKKILPIQFSVPRDRYAKGIHIKTQLVAKLIPACTKYSQHYDTYTFQTEDEYYADYANSYFAVTSKKGGWDCLRHYEIVAAGCLPYFINLKELPKETCKFLPHELLQAVHNFPILPISAKDNPQHHGDLVKPGLTTLNHLIDMEEYRELVAEFLDTVPASEDIADYVLESIL